MPQNLLKKAAEQNNGEERFQNSPLQTSDVHLPFKFSQTSQAQDIWTLLADSFLLEGERSLNVIVTLTRLGGLASFRHPLAVELTIPLSMPSASLAF